MARESILGSDGAPPLVWLIAAIFIGFEMAFQGAEAGILPLGDIRWEVYLRLAFFDLFFDAFLAGHEAPFRLWTSFLTHAALHGGLLHLFMNTAIFLAIGGAICRQIGGLRFLALFVLTAAGGALLFGLLASVQGPLVGASGVIFGLFGAMKRWEWRWLAITGRPRKRFWGSIIGLAAINILLFFAVAGGVVAWEAHLGGFIAGWLAAPLVAPGRAMPAPF